MYYKKFIIVFFLLFLVSNMSAQSSSDLTFEVLNDSLELTNKSQEISIQITNQMLRTPQSYSIAFENIECNWMLIDVKLNGEKLWLIKANTLATNEKVIAWNFDKRNSKLILYPYSWNSPYVLELIVQVNIKNSSSDKNKSSAEITLNAELGDVTIEAMPTGRGKNIEIK